jgi:hypothetical protein
LKWSRIPQRRGWVLAELKVGVAHIAWDGANSDLHDTSLFPAGKLWVNAPSRLLSVSVMLVSWSMLACLNSPDVEPEVNSASYRRLSRMTALGGEFERGLDSMTFVLPKLWNIWKRSWMQGVRQWVTLLLLSY